MRVLVVVQARTGSTRFPGKVLAEIDGQPLIGFMLDRIRPLADDLDTRIVVATSTQPADDALAAIAARKGFAAVRGSETDVLGRFGLALAQHAADLVVRLTADCPLMDPAVVRAAVAEHLATGADYTSNTLARTFPDGMDVEVITAGALQWAIARAQAPDEREHVTPHLQRHPELVQIAQLVDPAQAGYERWTVDRPEDLATIRAAIEPIERPLHAGWTEILAHLGRRVLPGIRAWPAEVELHARGEPYHRRWTVEDDTGGCGTALVVVTEGGRGLLRLDGRRTDAVGSAVRERLGADLQVTKLTSAEGAAK